MEKSFDNSPVDQNSFGDLGMDLNEMVRVLIAPAFVIITFCMPNNIQ